MDAALATFPRRLIDLTEAEFDAKLARLETLPCDQKRAIDAGIADRLQQLGVGIVRQRPFDAAGRLRADQRHQRHQRLAGLPGELLVEAEVGVEEHEVGGQRLDRQFRPAACRLEADRRQLARDRLHRRMRPMQYERLGAAEIASLRQRVAERHTIVRAVAALTKGADDGRAYQQLRSLAMGWQISMEEAARRIVAMTDEEGGDDQSHRA